MINGFHAIVYTKDAEKARAFFKDVLGFKSVDAGRGWLIFALPPAEIAAHPTEGDVEEGHSELYFLCDDVKKTVEDLKRKGVEFTTPISEQRWGIVTQFKIPGGGKVGLYQPLHPLAHGAPKA